MLNNNCFNDLVMLSLFNNIIYTQGKILHTRRPKLRFCAQHGVLCQSVKASFLLFLSEMENREGYHGGLFNNKYSVFTQYI